MGRGEVSEVWNQHSRQMSGFQTGITVFDVVFSSSDLGIGIGGGGGCGNLPETCIGAGRKWLSVGRGSGLCIFFADAKAQGA